MIQLSGLWLNESVNGNKYMVGYLGRNKILVFRNQHKTVDNQPDYLLYLADNPPAKPEEQDKPPF